MEGKYEINYWKKIFLFTKTKKTNTCFGCFFMNECSRTKIPPTFCRDKTIQKEIKKELIEFLGSGRF